MINTLKKFLKSSLFRYLLVGGFSYAVEISFLFFFTKLLKIDPVVGVAISFWIGFITAFVLQKLIAFKNKGTSKKQLAKQVVLYGVLVVFNYLFTLLFVSVTINHVDVLASRTIALGLTTAWNFVIYSRLIFKPTDKGSA